MLEQNPKIGKIGISGWSLGGTVALYSSWSPLVEILGMPFDAHLPFYPMTHLRPDIKEWTDAPKLILHGAADDWTPVHFVESCCQLPNANPEGLSPMHIIRLIVSHDYTYLPKAVHLKKRTIRIDKNGSMSGKALPRSTITYQQTVAEWIDSLLRNRGATVEGNTEARAECSGSFKNFLLSIFHSVIE